MQAIDGLIKDVENICLSYLTKEEQIYIRKERSKFNKDEVCNIAAENGWLDLLMWGKINGCHSDSWTCNYAALNGIAKVEDDCLRNNLQLLSFVNIKMDEIERFCKLYVGRVSQRLNSE